MVTVNKIFKTMVPAAVICGAIGYVRVAPSAKQDIPIQDRIVVDRFEDSKKRINVHVIDGFSQDRVDIDGDFLPDVSHGFVTSKIIERELPNANVYKHNIHNDSNSLPDWEKVDSVLSLLLKKVESKEHIDAINMSIGIDVPYDNFSKEVLGGKLKPKNLKKNRLALRKLLKNDSSKYIVDKLGMIRVSLIDSVLTKLDTFAKKGTKIFIASGNEHNSSFNILTLGDGVYSVSAKHSNGGCSNYSNNNSITNRWGNGDIHIVKTKDGYDITGDGKTDIKYNETTCPFKTTASNLEGTSFAAPRGLCDEFKKQELKAFN